jgi:hypothetical protein
MIAGKKFYAEGEPLEDSWINRRWAVMRGLAAEIDILR